MISSQSGLAIRPAAAACIAELVRGDDRVLVTGASGWFGRTTIALLLEAHGPGVLDRVLATGSYARKIQLGQYKIDVANVDIRRIKDFAPTQVVNCAFPTRELVPELGWDLYIASGTRSTALWLQTLTVPSVTTGITFSSGAAIRQSDGLPEWDSITNPYGFLKAVEEQQTLEMATRRGIGVSVARTFSVSGGLVSKVDLFAFSDFVRQASSGSISVDSNREVWRRYCLIDDLIALAWMSAASGASRIIPSGGRLHEIGELASRIAQRMGAHVAERPRLPGQDADRSYEPSTGFEDSCRRFGFEPAGIDEQIDLVACGLDRQSAI
jgi:nucleoside-diphosphate-sugar epimerase